MNEKDFVRAFEDYCKEHDRKGHFEKSVYNTISFVFDDQKIESGFSKLVYREKELSKQKQ